MQPLQFRRLAGLLCAAASLIVVSIWFASGATAPLPMRWHASNTSRDWYVVFYTEKDAEAARLIQQLKDKGYPATDAVSTGVLTGHSIIIQQAMDGDEMNARMPRLSKELGQAHWSSGTLQEAYLWSDLSKGKYSFGRIFVVSVASVHAFALRAFLFVMAISAAAAAALALLLLGKAPKAPAILWLGLGLGGWSLIVSYLWLYSVAPVFAAYQPASLYLRLGLDVTAFLLLLLSCHAYIRFWKGFPQPVSDEELDRFLAALKAEQMAKTGLSPRRWLRLFHRRDGDAAAQPADPQIHVVPEPGLAGWLKWGLIVLIVVCAGLSWTGSFFLFNGRTGLAPFLLDLLSSAALVLDLFAFVVLTYWPGLTCLRVFRYHRLSGSAEDCRKIEWIWASIWLGFVMVVLPLFMLAVIEVGRYFIPALEDAEGLAGGLLIAGLSCGPLLVILALAVSILYRGTIDPRLALRGVTMWSVLGVVLTLVFVLVERSIAIRIAKWWDLSPQTGYVTAGAIVAATFQPLRKQTEAYVTRFVERVLPANMLSAGTRRTQGVAVVDISAYTALSAKDEPSALVASALVQKEARRLAGEAGGRVVKSTGDGVIMCFDAAQSALTCVMELHRVVRAGATTLNLPDISLHSGLHWGEVVEMQDGDIYGMTVNLAARIADWAQAGEIGVSRGFHEQLAPVTAEFQDAGPQSFKNVPEPLLCLRLLVS